MFAEAPLSRRKSEVKSNLSSERTRSDVMRPAEGGKEVIECVLVGHVDGSEPQTQLVFVALE